MAKGHCILDQPHRLTPKRLDRYLHVLEYSERFPIPHSVDVPRGLGGSKFGSGTRSPKVHVIDTPFAVAGLFKQLSSLVGHSTKANGDFLMTIL